MWKESGHLRCLHTWIFSADHSQNGLNLPQLCEAFLFTLLHAKLLNFKFLSRPWRLAQELWAGRRKPCFLRKSSLLAKAAGSDLLPWTWWEQALLCCPLVFLSLPQAGFAGRWSLVCCPNYFLLQKRVF